MNLKECTIMMNSEEFTTLCFGSLNKKKTHIRSFKSYSLGKLEKYHFHTFLSGVSDNNGPHIFAFRKEADRSELATKCCTPQSFKISGDFRPQIMLVLFTQSCTKNRQRENILCEKERGGLQ